ncbi:MAG: type II toxin-antitoxin system VapC family toxin [Nitrospirota bacterium]
MAEHPSKLILDTSIYIPFINDGIAHPIVDFPQGHPIFFMSAVVMEELYAGASDAVTIRLLDRLFDTFAKLNRMATPDALDWRKAGRIIAQLGRKYGFEDVFLSRITHDVLIALSARRIGASVVTNNLKDFLRIQEYVDVKIFAG